jgi:hypothetical protein
MYCILEADAELATVDEVFEGMEGHELPSSEFEEIQKRFKFSKK